MLTSPNSKVPAQNSSSVKLQRVLVCTGSSVNPIDGPIEHCITLMVAPNARSNVDSIPFLEADCNFKLFFDHSYQHSRSLLDANQLITPIDGTSESIDASNASKSYHLEKSHIDLRVRGTGLEEEFACVPVSFGNYEEVLQVVKGIFLAMLITEKKIGTPSIQIVHYSLHLQIYSHSLSINSASNNIFCIYHLVGNPFLFNISTIMNHFLTQMMILVTRNVLCLVFLIISESPQRIFHKVPAKVPVPVPVPRSNPTKVMLTNLVCLMRSLSLCKILLILISQQTIEGIYYHQYQFP